MCFRICTCVRCVCRRQGLKPEDLPEEEQFVTVRKRFSRMIGASGNAGEEGGDDAEQADSFGFGEGGFYTFHSFRRKAQDFRDKWFSGWHRRVSPPLPSCRLCSLEGGGGGGGGVRLGFERRVQGLRVICIQCRLHGDVTLYVYQG